MITVQCPGSGALHDVHLNRLGDRLRPLSDPVAALHFDLRSVPCTARVPTRVCIIIDSPFARVKDRGVFIQYQTFQPALCPNRSLSP